MPAKLKTMKVEEVMISRLFELVFSNQNAKKVEYLLIVKHKSIRYRCVGYISKSFRNLIIDGII